MRLVNLPSTCDDPAEEEDAERQVAVVWSLLLVARLGVVVAVSHAAHQQCATLHYRLHQTHAAEHHQEDGNERLDLTLVQADET